MIITRMKASFGRLQNQTLNLNGGLNVIEGPNESGKSTWVAFLRAMLYGINSKERNRKDFIAEKNKYKPWSGAPLEGRMDVLFKDREITIRRSGSDSSPFSNFKAVYTATGDAVPDMTAESAGEILTGLDRSSFERSAYIGQDAMVISDSSELERRINAIVTTGQEEMSYSDASEKLKSWRNLRKSSRSSGAINQLEKEKSDCSYTLGRMEEIRRKVSDLESEASELNERRGEIEKAALKRAEEAAQKQRAAYDEAFEECKNADEELGRCVEEGTLLGEIPDDETLQELRRDCSYHEKIQEKISGLKNEIDTASEPAAPEEIPPLKDLEPDDALKKAETDYECVNRGPDGRTALIVSLIVLAVAVITGLVLFLIFNTDILWALICCLAVAVIAAVFMVISIRVERKSRQNISDILRQYKAETAGDILTRANEYESSKAEYEEGKAKLDALTIQLQQYEKDADEIRGHLIENVQGFAPEVQDVNGVSASVDHAIEINEKIGRARQRKDDADRIWNAISQQGRPGDGPVNIQDLNDPELNSIRDQINQNKIETSQLNGELKATGDPAELEARVDELNHQIESLQREYDAITLAISALDSANSILQEKISPVLNAYAEDLFNQLTGGENVQFSLNRQLEAEVSRPEDVNPHNKLELSAGTVDQLYLAVRLALSELLISDKNNPPPLIFDDAFVRFDDHRLALALELLRKMAGDRQILIFTCQNRERQILSGYEDVSVITL